jgi:DNA-binding transcriptional ArsR family regulator
LREESGTGFVSEPIQQMKAEFFKALAHPARIRILEILSERECSVGELVTDVGLESSHLSQQLGVLRRANLVITRKSGNSVYYRLADRRLAKLLELAKQILLEYLTTARDLLTDVKS